VCRSTSTREALKLYFQFSYIPDPWSPYKAVKKLPPGSWLTYDASGAVKQGRYWTLPAPVEDAKPGDTPETAKARVREAFDDGSADPHDRRRTARRVSEWRHRFRLGCRVDGAAVQGPGKNVLHCFEEAAFNELPYAAMVAKKYNTEHHEILVKPEAVSLVSRLVRHFDEPFGDASAIPTFIVSEFAVRYVKVSLSGDGGDELFTGYPQFWGIENDRRFDRIPQIARQGLSLLASMVPYSAYGKNYLHMIRPVDGAAALF